MACSYVIVDGPSIFDLMLGLFEPDPPLDPGLCHKRRIVFKVMPLENDRAEEWMVRIDAVARVHHHHTTDWRIRIQRSVVSRNDTYHYHYEGTYSTKDRKGNLTPVEQA